MSLVWFASGFFACIIVQTWRLSHRNFRRSFFRHLAQHWPEELERALGHNAIVNPPRPRHVTFDAIQFGMCKHCGLAWPMTNRTLEAHPFVIGPDNGRLCPGSGTQGEKC